MGAVQEPEEQIWRSEEQLWRPGGQDGEDRAHAEAGTDPSKGRVSGPADGAGPRPQPIGGDGRGNADNAGNTVKTDKAGIVDDMDGTDGELERLRRWRAERRAAHALTADPRWARPPGYRGPDAGGRDTSGRVPVVGAPRRG
ncbi:MULTISPECIES: hypothetical protein [Protofrankia]|nr:MULTISPECIES: hypothetical protein [Protofrankia]